RLLQGVLILSLAVAAWFFPMVSEAGGIQQYSRALWDLWNIVPGAPTPGSPIILSFARGATIAFILVLTFGLAGAMFLLRIPNANTGPVRGFLLVWILPAICFFTLVFLKFVNSGYLLLITPPLFALLGNRAALL